MLVILTGPESTGKSTLAEQLAWHFHGLCVPEYAREYLQDLGRAYSEADVLHIARHQRSQMEQYVPQNQKPVFFDTYLEVTKIWLLVRYGSYPEWIDASIQSTTNALYLLCRPDIPWFPDVLRENGGGMRDQLYKQYQDELLRAGLNYRIVSGENEARLQTAINHIHNYQKTG